jgi:hypothetical protein
LICQDLQAEHMNMRVIDCINDYYAIMEVGPAHSLIPGARPSRYRSGVSQLPNNPLTGIYRDMIALNLVVTGICM